jgi:DNA-directed RNA polymerase specialized sigma24 family protein
VDAEREYRQFVLEVANRLFRTAFVLTNDRQLAEDLVQQTLLKVWRYWRHVREADDPYSYVRRILLTSHSRMHRRRRVSEVLTAAPHEQEGEGPLVEERDQVLRALDRLPYWQKAVLLLRF